MPTRIILAIVFLCSTLHVYAQQRGEIVSVEQNLDLTPEAVWDYFVQSQGAETSVDLQNYINGISLGLEAYKITYYTPNYEDQLIKATGLVMFPKTNKKLSTVVYCRTTTDHRDNSPSNLSELLEVGFVFPLAFALSEYIVIAPDNIGMGDGDGTNYYADAKTTTTAIIDMMDAANTFLDSINKVRYEEYFLTGYSLGAHGGMAVLRETTQSNTYQFKHAYFGGGPYDLRNSTFQKGMLDKSFYPTSWIIANFGWVCHKMGYSLIEEGESWDAVISPDYLSQFENSIVNDQWGILWGPFTWRNLLTPLGLSRVEAADSPIIDCLLASDVYDWYNTTPTTMMTAWFDLHIPPVNAIVTRDVQRGYYPWWNWDKYQIKQVDGGPFEHITGFFPWIMASTYKFNTLRTGGFFNLQADYTSRGPEAEEVSISSVRSSINPQILINGKKSSVRLKPLDVPEAHKTTEHVTGVDLSQAKAGIYMAEANINKKKITFPYVIEEAVEVQSEDVFRKINDATYEIYLNGLTDKLVSITFYDAEGRAVKHIDVDQPAETYSFDLNGLNGGEQVEIVAENTIFKTVFHKPTTHISNTVYLVKSDAGTRVESKHSTISKVQIYNTMGQLLFTQEGLSTRTYLLPSQYQGAHVAVITDSEGNSHIKKYF